MPVLVIDQDQQRHFRAPSSPVSAPTRISTVKPSTLDDARVAVRKGKATVAIVIPKDFGIDAGTRLFYSGAAKPELRVLYDPSHAMEFGMVQGILSGAVMQIGEQGDVHRQERARDGEGVAGGNRIRQGHGRRGQEGLARSAGQRARAGTSSRTARKRPDSRSPRRA